MIEELVDDIVEGTSWKCWISCRDNFQCNVFSKSFNKIQRLNTHIKGHLNDWKIQKEKNDVNGFEMILDILNNAKCNEIMDDIQYLGYHVTNVHWSEAEYISESDNVLSHIDKIHCDVCYYKDSSDKEMLGHIQTGHLKETSFICGECGESFDENKKCITHLYSHQNLNLYKDPVPTFPRDKCNYISLKISILKIIKLICIRWII